MVVERAGRLLKQYQVQHWVGGWNAMQDLNCDSGVVFAIGVVGKYSRSNVDHVSCNYRRDVL